MNDKTPDPAPLSDEEVVPAPSPEPKPDDQAKPSDAEPVADETPAEAQTEEQEAEEEAPAKPKSSGYARLKARHQALLARLQQYESQPPQQEQAEREPRVEDFNGDYLAFEKAAVAYAARNAVRDEMQQARQRDFQTREAESRQENLQDFFEKTEEVKGQFKDFDQAIDALYGSLGPLPPVMRDLLADADNGPVILYHLAKNPGLARDLYASDPISAAKELGRLEANLSLPKARNQTKAPPPINPPKGGAAPPSDPFRLAAKSEDISDYVAFRKKERAP